MNKIEVWYTIEKSNGVWVVWMNKESNNSYGSYGIYKSQKKKECIEYCKKSNIKIDK